MAIDQAVFSLDSISKMSSLEHLKGSFDFAIGESDKAAGHPLPAEFSRREVTAVLSKHFGGSGARAATSVQ